MRKVLARGIAAGMAVVVLTAPGPAVGGGEEPRSYSGAFEEGGKISFRLVDGNKRRVDKIVIEGIHADCERDTTGFFDFHIYGDTPVLRDRSFAVRSEDGSGGKAVVRGRFARKFKSVKGTARVHGRFLDGSTRCDSGKQKFVGT